ncbi:leucine-rich repeat extensin-like protein 3 [Drosophila willistoni]|uniref:leucine-rich repeat extensin-like protein 3 n=1 Tax=Drosophila willistoni TaxID=7260 RepID=UPI001F085DDE|nr:leucine-rich repeat extensin-like protein 3 [Drosophila willistoni]
MFRYGSLMALCLLCVLSQTQALKIFGRAAIIKDQVDQIDHLDQSDQLDSMEDDDPEPEGRIWQLAAAPPPAPAPAPPAPPPSPHFYQPNYFDALKPIIITQQPAPQQPQPIFYPPSPPPPPPPPPPQHQPYYPPYFPYFFQPQQQQPQIILAALHNQSPRGSYGLTKGISQAQPQSYYMMPRPVLAYDSDEDYVPPVNHKRRSKPKKSTYVVQKRPKKSKTKSTLAQQDDELVYLAVQPVTTVPKVENIKPMEEIISKTM